jgi:tetratricopeptide (TPR) repeat protein
MSLRPVIFISAVSSELSSARQLVANTLTFLGYEPVWQDVFDTGEGDLRSTLRRRIDACKGVLQLVGECYGTEPPNSDAHFGRVSYTQYEALYALTKGKKVWYLFLDSGFPSDPHEPEDRTRWKLQSDYRSRMKGDSHLYHPLGSREGLEASVLKLRGELNRLRTGVRRWAALVVFLLVLTIGLALLHIRQQGQSQEKVDRQFADMRDIISKFAQREAELRQNRPKEEPETAREEVFQELAKDYGLDPQILKKELPAFAEMLKRAPTATMYERANAAYVAMDYNEAERLALTAADEASAAKPPKDSEVVKALELAALAADKRIDYSAALKHLQRAEHLTNRMADPVEWAGVEFGIAGVFHNQGRYQDSEGVWQEVLKERRRALGAEDPQTLAARDGLAEALEYESDYAGAEAEYREVIKLRTKILGPEHAETLASRSGLANTLDDQGKYQEAEAEYRAVLEIRTTKLGPEHPDTLGTRHNIAGVLDDEGKYPEAETEYRAVVKLRAKVLGPDDPATLGSRHNLATVLDDEGKYAEAEAEYRDILRLKEKVLGPEHPKTLLTRGNLAGLLQTEGKYAEAEAEDRVLIRLREKVLGPEHRETIAARHNLGEALNELGKFPEAETEERAVIALEEKVLGPTHPFTLETRSDLARTLADEKHYHEAEAEYRAVLQLKEKALGPEHPDELKIYFNLAVCLRAENELAEARDFAERAAKGAVKVLGPEHPDTKRYQQLQTELQATRN